ncbi:malonate transporter [Tardiphaga robiniae]|uniref:AEC family transporter n=1 Tax=Tardiphaga robiniae TaxID=943830 RepID=UPI00286030BD|nr:AEC family transporter [Tardiphaga robiniae]MDR6661301.1 malonate transporter [Tardiphaga robiniae]
MALVPIFFVLLLGYAAGKIRIVDNHHVDGLNALVMDFALPASLFAATASAPRSEMVAQGPLFVVFGLTMLILFAVWFWGVRSVFNVTKSDASLQALTISFPNLAGVGLPIVASVLGPKGAVPVAVALAAGSILISPLSLIIVEISTNKDRGVEMSVRQIAGAVGRAITKPVILAPALGILLSLSGFELNALAHGCLTLIGSAAAGVALFVTGLVLSAQSFRLDWKVVAATAASDIMRPLLAAAIVYLCPISPEAAKTVILLAAVPSGFFGILFAVNYRLDSATTGSMVIASTVFSIATLATAILVLFPH